MVITLLARRRHQLIIFKKITDRQKMIMHRISRGTIVFLKKTPKLVYARDSKCVGTKPLFANLPRNNN